MILSPFLSGTTTATNHTQKSEMPAEEDNGRGYLASFDFALLRYPHAAVDWRKDALAFFVCVIHGTCAVLFWKTFDGLGRDTFDRHYAKHDGMQLERQTQKVSHTSVTSLLLLPLLSAAQYCPETLMVAPAHM